MKKLWFAVIAALSFLLVAERPVEAQNLGAGSMFRGSNGQAYMLVPNEDPNVEAAGYAAQEGSGSHSCVDGNCGSSCCDTCCPTGWTHCNYVYGGFLFLRARNAEVPYAMPVTGPINPQPPNAPANLPAGAIRVLDQDFNPGYFVGFGHYLDECSSIGVQYTQFESSTNDAITLPGGGPFIRSLVSLPAAAVADVDVLNAAATHSIKYKMLDFDYRNLFAYDCDYQLNYLIGTRIVQMNQNLDASFTQLGNVRNRTDIDFYGAGLRLGLEGERYARRGFMVYGKGFISLVPGEFKADYSQTSTTAAATNLNASWTAGRIVTIADLELGVGWTNCCGNLRLSAGYLFSAWGNVVQTSDWVKATQTATFVNSFDNLGSTMTFDGLVARIEGRW